MKRIFSLMLAIFVLWASWVYASAESEAYDYSQIWESFGVNSSEEMYEETLAYLRSQNPGAWAITKEYLPCNIRYGGTTEELLADWKNWDLAVVSSKDVDLRALVERKDLIEKFPVSLTSDINIVCRKIFGNFFPKARSGTIVFSFMITMRSKMKP